MSGEDAPRPYLENLIVLEIKTNKQECVGSTHSRDDPVEVRATALAMTFVSRVVHT
jgi:hypothetical protein